MATFTLLPGKTVTEDGTLRANVPTVKVSVAAVAETPPPVPLMVMEWDPRAAEDMAFTVMVAPLKLTLMPVGSTLVENVTVELKPAFATTLT